jgi:protein-tyrosine-phosphatase
MKKVLFLCTGNMNRSYAAHVLATDYLLDEVDSAGTGRTCGGKLANKKMREALERIEYPLDHLSSLLYRKSKKLTQELADWADVIVCMAEIHRKNVIAQFGLTYAEKCVIFMPDGSDVPDPHFSKDPADFDRVIKLIQDNMRDF